MTRAFRPWLLLPALLALIWYWPCLGFGFRSDDFQTVYYVDRAAGTVRWERVLEEFARPWFGVHDLYRPLVSLSYGVNHALASSPATFHLFNVLLAGATAAMLAATAAACRLAAPALGATVAAALFLLHPAAVEPTAWIAARTSGLQQLFVVATWALFLRHRSGGGARWPYVATALLAMLSKEGAVTLPASLLCVDVLARGRPRWRAHAPVWLLTGGYLVFRRLLLGCFFTHGESPGLGSRLTGLGDQLSQVAAAPGPWGGPTWWLLLPLGVVLSLAPDGLRRIGSGLALVAALALPTSHMVAGSGGFDGRLVYDPMAGLALLAGVGAGAAGRALRPVALIAAFVLGLGLAVHNRGWLERFAAGERRLEAATGQLLAAARDAVPGRPFGVAAMLGQPLMLPRMWGVLGLRPFAAADRALVAMPELLQRDASAPDVFGDAAPVHALAADGAGVGFWLEQTSTFVTVPASPVAAIAMPAVSGRPGEFAAGSPLAATACAAVEVELPRPARRVRLRLLDDLQGEFAFGWRAVALPEPGTRVWFDTSRAIAPFVLGGTCRGFFVEVDGAPAPAGTVVRVHALAAAGDAPDAGGDAVDRDELAALLVPPRRDVPLRCYLLLPTALLSLDVAPGAAVEVPAGARAQVVYAADLLGGARLCWFWQSLDDGARRPWRSGLRSVLVR